MKKRLLAALLVIAMMASIIVMPAYATESAEQYPAGYCQHCKQVIPEDQWIPWDITNTDPYSGHYYLAEDINAQESQISIILDDDLYRYVVCLDLRGHSYTVEGKRPFLIYGILSIMDSVGGGEIAVTGYTTKTNSYGGFCQLGKESVSKDGSGELNLYSGTIRKINADGHTTAKGGLIYAYSDATLNVYGGKLIGGQVTPRLDSKGAPINFVGGGTIFADNGNINIYGGTVTGGEADNTSLVLPDETVTYNVYGGNIYAINGSKITISGGSVENGYSDTYGGNLCLRASTLEISGGTITGGYAKGTGGNIMLLDASTFKMSGGTIKNGVSIGRGGNLFVNKNLIDIEISGGEIYGDVSVENFKSIKLSGSPKIYMGLSNGLRLQAAKATKMDISGLKQGAEIYLDGVDQVFTGVLENPETYLAYFKDAIRADISIDASGALRVDQGTTGFCPHCWKSGEQATWTVWGNKAGTASAGVYSITSSVHYYLSEDCVRDKPGKESGNRMGVVSAGSSTVKTNDVVIDTAGYTWTTTGNKVFNVRSTLSLVDSEGGGKIIGAGKKTDAGNGGMIQVVNTTSVFNLYSGTLQRTISGDDYINDLMGGILYAPAGSSVNIYGGTIRDGVSASISAAESERACKGGNICALGNFTMTAGALIGGKSYNNSYIKQDTAAPIVIGDKNVTLTGIGGNLYAAGETNISGGHIVEGTACQGGGIYIANTAEVNISDCVIRNNTAGETGGAVNSDFDPAYQGGNIYIAGTSGNRLELTLSDFILRSGNSKEQGGNIYADYADLTLRDILIADGNADTHGGNIYLPKTVVCDMYDSVIGNGVAGTNGGNLYGAKGVVFNLHSGLICGGTANTSGGNLHCTGLNMSGGIVTGGTAGDKGGNIYVLKSGNTLRIEDDGDSATPAPVFSNGSSASNGPNIYLGDSNTGYLTGAIIHGGGVYGYFNSSLILTDCSVDGIIADDSYGKGVYAGGALTLKGNTTVTNEQNKSCVYIHGNGSLTVDAGFTGAASVAFAESHFENAAAPQGGHVAEKNTAGGVFTGTLLLEDRGDYEYSLPAIFAVSGDNKLYIASTAIVDEETGEITWFKDAGSAAAELDDGEYLRLHATENTMELNRNVAVDLNGNKLTVSGEGTVYGFDSSNDDYDGYGTVEVIGTGVSFEPSYYAPNGNQYVTLADENGISFHRMGIRISSVSLRPSASGVYFEGMWECDDILADKIDTFGIALSVEKMPDNNFAADTKYTEHAKDDFVSGIAKTSVLVKNILKENEDNQARGTMEIYATPYVTVNSGIVNNLTIVCDDRNGTPDGVAWTLKDVMQAVNRIWPKLDDKQQAVVKGMYNGYADVLETWDLYNTTAAYNGTAAIRPLKILTLGHSLAVDSCHMLNMVAAAQGYSEEFIVGTLYYSGCQFYKHVNFLRDNSPVYSLYISNSKTPDAPPTIEEDITMEYGIKYDDWDIIIMQGGVFEISRESDMSNGNIQIIQDYVQEQKTNPNAILAYHMPWAPPVDNDLRDLYTKSPNSYYTNYAKYNDDRSALFAQMAYLSEKYIMTDSNFIYFIPSGTAIENALSSYLTEKDLHRDYVHVSDLGRLIASYTWYCTLAGIEKLDEVKVDAIPMAFLKSTKDKTQDRVLTEAEKAIILEAVNNALANPLEMTQSQYTTAPTN